MPWVNLWSKWLCPPPVNNQSWKFGTILLLGHWKLENEVLVYENFGLAIAYSFHFHQSSVSCFSPWKYKVRLRRSQCCTNGGWRRTSTSKWSAGGPRLWIKWQLMYFKIVFFLGQFVNKFGIKQCGSFLGQYVCFIVYQEPKKYWM